MWVDVCFLLALIYCSGSYESAMSGAMAWCRPPHISAMSCNPVSPVTGSMDAWHAPARYHMTGSNHIHHRGSQA